MTYRRNTRAQSMFVVDQEIKRSIKLKLNEKKKQIRIGLLLELFLFSLLSPFFSNFTMTLILHGYSIKTIEINQNKTKKWRHEKWKVVFRLLNSNLLTNAISNFENENQDNSKLIEHKKTTQNSSSGIEL